MLPKADIRHVQLQGAILLKAKLQGVIGWDKTQLQGAILGGAQLQGASLIEADLQGADLRGADLQGSDLSWTILQSADLRGANLRAADLRGAKLQAADLRGAKLQGANLRKAKLQGVNLVYANLQGTDLSEAELQGAKLRETQLQGSDWTNARLDATFIADSSWSDWDEQRQRQLEARLKQILDDERFNTFQARMKRADTGLSPGKAASREACYSDNRALLKCEYDNPAQLNTYRTRALHPALIELACSDASIAPGIARRSLDKFTNKHPDFGLAAALLKILDDPKPCAGLAGAARTIATRIAECGPNNRKTRANPK